MSDWLYLTLFILIAMLATASTRAMPFLFLGRYREHPLSGLFRGVSATGGDGAACSLRYGRLASSGRTRMGEWVVAGDCGVHAMV